ncbi:MAG: hypothetical protein IJD13_05915 [Oscillospiraceae bacterium]|nr:hypothetical protein [Oscillospiraceae bacterium]
MRKNEKNVFLTLLNIYWPVLLFGGIQLGFTLIRRGTAPLEKWLDHILNDPFRDLAWFILLCVIVLLTLLLIILRCSGKTETPSDREEQIVDVTDTYADEEERFPGLNYRLRPEKRSGEPALVERVFIPRTVSASSVRRTTDTLRLTAGGKEKLAVPVRPGTHTVHLDGYTVTLTVEKTGLEDVTRELPRL